MLALIIVLIVVGLLAIGGVATFVVGSGRADKRAAKLPPAARRDVLPGVGDDAEVPRDSAQRSVATIDLPTVDLPLDAEQAVEAGVDLSEPIEISPEAPAVEVPLPTQGRLTRLRDRLSRSQGAVGQTLFGLLSREALDEDTWEEIEDVLLQADLGVAATQEVVGNLRTKARILGTRTPAGVRELLESELLSVIGGADRELRTAPAADGTPAVVLVVGVNGTGKTTTCGKLARVLVADGRSVILGAADTFRAAAADQLTTWGERVGARTVRGPEGGDPASIAFDAVKDGVDAGVDTVLIDTAGRLHTKTGLMDELGKVKRVIEKQAPLSEVLLVLDATTGQNGVVQARVFTEAVDVTGIVLTKLDGTAKGGIVVSVQRELGIPVKLIGLGEGPDDLAPFEPAAFVDALLGDVVGGS